MWKNTHKNDEFTMEAPPSAQKEKPKAIAFPLSVEAGQLGQQQQQANKRIICGDSTVCCGPPHVCAHMCNVHLHTHTHTWELTYVTHTWTPYIEILKKQTTSRRPKFIWMGYNCW